MTRIGRTLAGVPTPAAVVDLAVLRRNAERMLERARRLGVRLRPHVKTHKCVEAARIQTDGASKGITVSTLAEARRFAAAGFRDITYAFPFPPGALSEAAEIADGIDRLTLLVDQVETTRMLAEFARRQRRVIPVLLEFDCGDHRSGVDPAHPEGLALAREIAGSDGLSFEGVLTHAGQSYGCRGSSEARAVAIRERDVALSFATRLREAGLEIRNVSIGSTPTVVHSDRLEGITEIRPGNYLFFDAFQAAIGSCRLEDVAFSVLATVTGRYPARDEAIVNAGALALSKDVGPTHVDPECGFGRIAGGDLRVASLSQEHGIVRGPGAGRLEIGATVRILPNHACLAAAQFETFHVVEDDVIVEEWSPARGW